MQLVVLLASMQVNPGGNTRNPGKTIQNHNTQCLTSTCLVARPHKCKCHSGLRHTVVSLWPAHSVVWGVCGIMLWQWLKKIWPLAGTTEGAMSHGCECAAVWMGRPRSVCGCGGETTNCSDKSWVCPPDSHLKCVVKSCCSGQVGLANPTSVSFQSASSNTRSTCIRKIIHGESCMYHPKPIQ